MSLHAAQGEIRRAGLGRLALGGIARWCQLSAPAGTWHE
jgi:hypothetical protein